MWPLPRAVRTYAIATEQYGPLLFGAEIPSEGILQYVGAHYDDVFKWGRRRHWIGLACGQNCECCRAAIDGSGCHSCADLWFLKCCSQTTRWRVSTFNGLGSRWQWEYGTFGAS